MGDLGSMREDNTRGDFLTRKCCCPPFIPGSWLRHWDRRYASVSMHEHWGCVFAHVFYGFSLLVDANMLRCENLLINCYDWVFDFRVRLPSLEMLWSVQQDSTRSCSESVFLQFQSERFTNHQRLRWVIKKTAKCSVIRQRSIQFQNFLHEKRANSRILRRQLRVGLFLSNNLNPVRGSDGWIPKVLSLKPHKSSAV